MKRKYITVLAMIALVCETFITPEIYEVKAENVIENQYDEANATDTQFENKSEEEVAYEEFLAEGKYFFDVRHLYNVEYDIYDINNDGIKELIIRGKTGDKYEYCFYYYKNNTVVPIGSFQNWQNGGDGEMYYMKQDNEIVVYNRLSDRLTYRVYQVKYKIKKVYSVSRQDIKAMQGSGNNTPVYEYTIRDENGEEKTITEGAWGKFENNLQELSFTELEVKCDLEPSERQMKILKEGLGVPEDVEVTKCEVKEVWYWEGVGYWLVNINLYADDDLLASASINPFTLQPERNFYFYETSRADKASKEAEATEASKYILPDVASRYMTEEELGNLTNDQIQLAINEIFARHGRCFKMEEFDQYFRSKSWYQPDPLKTDEEIIAEFNDYEKANEALLEKLREG